ncbi:MAG: hypothetical protein GF365_00215 [Candidatus Buchananbacteria bacterium]|nr:hypothetical protein [Candidatus Buchananbacteria bacterium]
MANGEKPVNNNQGEDEFAFEDVFDLSEQEKAELKDDSAEQDIEKKQQLAKETAFYLYDDIRNLVQGKPVDDSLKELIPEGEGLTNNLKALKDIDLMPILQEYFKIKKEEGAESAKLHLFFDIKNTDIESFIETLESISNNLDKDIIKDLIERHKLEQKFKKIDNFMKKTKTQYDEATGEDIELPFDRVYLSYASTFDELMDENNIKYLRGQELVDDDVSAKIIEERLSNIKDKLSQIIDWELESLAKQEFEYGQMSEEKREQLKKMLEDFKALDVSEIFDVKNLAFIGQILENRIGSLDQIEKEREKLNNKIGEYFPSPF